MKPLEGERWFAVDDRRTDRTDAILLEAHNVGKFKPDTRAETPPGRQIEPRIPA